MRNRPFIECDRDTLEKIEKHGIDLPDLIDRHCPPDNFLEALPFWKLFGVVVMLLSIGFLSAGWWTTHLKLEAARAELETLRETTVNKR